MNDLYEEHTELPRPWLEWVILAVYSALIVGFGLLVYAIIPDGPRHWDFGELPDTPAEGMFSTEIPRRRMTVPRQIPKLPEAQPAAAAKRRNQPAGEKVPSR